MLRRVRVISFLLVIGLLLNVHATAQTSQKPAPASQNPIEPPAQMASSLPLDYLIGPGDILSVRVYQQPDISGEFRVSVQGEIRMMFIDEPIKVTGYNEWQVASIVRDKLSAILREPQVSVQVKEARQDVAYILGAVNAPRSVPVYSETRLLTMLAAANGLSDRAGNIAYILRGSVWSSEATPNQGDSDDVRLSAVIETVDVNKMMNGAVELNKRIFPGDVISIPETGKVFIGGSVNKPDAYDMRTELSLAQAITMAGGTKPDAKKSKITIVRQDSNKTELTELVVNLGQIEKDASKDVKLQVGDVVFVPSSTAKTLGLSLLNSMAIQSALIPFYILRR